jgi:hypothetical protein
MSLTSELSIRFRATQLGPNDFGGAFQPTMEALLQTSFGTGLNQANLLFIDERTVASATNDDLDLAGVLTSAFGATITAAELVAIFIINAPRSGAANTTNLTIGGGSNPVVGFLGGTTPTVGPLRPGAFFCIGAGDAAGIGAVTASTGDILRIANSSGAAATYQIAILARNA